MCCWHVCVSVCRGRNEAAEAADRERFLQELEEDAEMRARVALFKDSTALAAAAAAPSGMAEGDDSDDEDGDLPQVSAAAVQWGALGLCCAAGDQFGMVAGAACICRLAMRWGAMMISHKRLVVYVQVALPCKRICMHARAYACLCSPHVDAV